MSCGREGLLWKGLEIQMEKLGDTLLSLPPPRGQHWSHSMALWSPLPCHSSLWSPLPCHS